MTFNRYDVIKIFGKKEATSMLCIFNRTDIGKHKQMLISSHCRHGECKSVVSIIHYDYQELVEYFKQKIESANADVFERKKRYIGFYNKTISRLEKIKMEMRDEQLTNSF